MMNKDLFTANMQKSVVTDDMTVAEAREAKKKAKSLLNRLKKEVLKQFHAQTNNKYDYGYVIDIPRLSLKTTGSFNVRVIFDGSGWGDFAASTKTSEVVHQERVNLKSVFA